MRPVAAVCNRHAPSPEAELYGIGTKRLNEAVKRNIGRFPADFMFQLTENEMENLRSQIATSRYAESGLLFQSGRSNSYGGRRKCVGWFSGPSSYRRHPQEIRMIGGFQARYA
ncbi:MAG: ORF6N domain-containing protein [Verrucomicrobiota bacterium]